MGDSDEEYEEEYEDSEGSWYTDEDDVDDQGYAHGFNPFEFFDFL